MRSARVLPLASSHSFATVDRHDFGIVHIDAFENLVDHTVLIVTGGDQFVVKQTDRLTFTYLGIVDGRVANGGGDLDCTNATQRTCHGFDVRGEVAPVVERQKCCDALRHGARRDNLD